MTAYVDNDIIVKLAALDLLDEFTADTMLRHRTIRILPTAKFKLCVAKNPEKGRKKYGDAVHERIVAFVNAAECVGDVVSFADGAALSAVVNIDPGELILFSAACHDENSVLVTGDKKAVLALALSRECAHIRQGLAGRVVSLEQVVAATIERLGFQQSLNKLCPGVACDTVMRAVFGSGSMSQELAVREALGSYVDSLREECAGLLSPSKPHS